METPNSPTPTPQPEAPAASSFGDALLQAMTKAGGSLPATSKDAPAAGSETPSPTPEGDQPAGAATPEKPAETATPEATTPEKPSTEKPSEAAAEGKLDDKALDDAEKRMTVQAGTAFKAVRSELKAEKERARVLEDRLKELESREPQVDTETVSQLQEKLKRYESELSVVRVEATEEFQKNITVPLQQATDTLSAFAKKYEVPENELYAALQIADPLARTDKLSELSANFNRLDLVRFDQTITDLERLGAERHRVLSNADAAYKQMLRQREDQARSAQTSWVNDWKKSSESTFAELGDQLPMFKPTGDAAWDKGLSEAATAVKDMKLHELPTREITEMAYKAKVFPMVLDVVADLYKQNQQLTERVNKVRSATPGAGTGSAPGAAVQSDLSGLTFKEVMSRRLSEAGIQ